VIGIRLQRPSIAVDGLVELLQALQGITHASVHRRHGRIDGQGTLV